MEYHERVDFILELYYLSIGYVVGYVGATNSVDKRGIGSYYGQNRKIIGLW